ncbi:PEP-CTERM sorting domain-containing protein [Azohydromonas aeria]|uniref:PEP-CTERM sorting domain-containing protein n=1 Tax=Azohydromonas aeria TaxID=2590212 RepID=UPI0012F7DE2F|nr:PEP-CTERM sorting domain-containing protein [Azohydromonas aeria]
MKSFLKSAYVAAFLAAAASGPALAGNTGSDCTPPFCAAPTPVPEPDTLALVVLGIAAVAFISKKKK